MQSHSSTASSDVSVRALENEGGKKKPKIPLDQAMEDEVSILVIVHCDFKGSVIYSLPSVTHIQLHLFFSFFQSFGSDDISL